MATSLQRQLAALAAPASAVLIPERRRTSILFTSQEAAGYNRDTFYQIGLDGLYELISTNGSLFKKFRDSILFDDASKNLERAIQEKETNDAIDEAIDQFLISVSPFLMMKSSLKCLEWLVYRFHIEKFNVNSILKCIMPYYDTKTFVLIVQVLEIDKFRRNKEWHWILPNVQTAVPISKMTLYSNVNANFIGWLFQTLQGYLKVHTMQENLRVYISFMTSTLVGVLATIAENSKRTPASNRNNIASIQRIWSELKSLLLEAKQGGRSKSVEEIHGMIYVLCAMLVQIGKDKPALCRGSEHFMGKMMGNILKTYPRSLRTQAYLISNALSANCDEQLNLPKAKLHRVLKELSALSSEWDLSSLAMTVMLHPVYLEEYHSSPKKIWRDLVQIELTLEQRSTFLRTLYTSVCTTPGVPKRKWTNKFLLRFEREYPAEFALASQDNDKFAKDFAKYSKEKDAFLLCQHPEEKMREQAVKTLLRRFKNKYISPKVKKTSKIAVVASKKAPKKIPLKKCRPDDNPTAQALLPRFRDENQNIVQILLKLSPKVLNKLYSHKTLIELLALVINRQLNNHCTLTALQKLLKIACKIEDDCLKSTVFAALIPFLFPSGGKISTRLASAILTSTFAQKEAFFQHYLGVVGIEPDKINANTLRELSYDLCNSNSASWTYDLWKESFTSATQVVFALLTLKSIQNFDDLVAAAESFDCIPSCGGSEVDKYNFFECVRLAERKNLLSLELVLGTILNVAKRDRNSQIRALEIVLKFSLNSKNRNTCAKFLHRFLDSTFSTPESQLQFWCNAIRFYNSENTHTSKSKEELEFYLIRVLQCLSSFIETLGKHVSNAFAKKEFISELILTQCLLHGSHRVRQNGLNCFQALVKTNYIEPDMKSFLKHLLSFREEIHADREQLSIVTSEALREDKYSKVMDRFNEIILNPENKLLAIGLLQLYKSTSAQSLLRFFPLIKNLLLNDRQSEVLMALLDCYDGSVDGSNDIFEIVSLSMKHKETCSKILSKFTPEIVEKHSYATKRKLFGNLIDSILNCEIADIKVAVQRCVRKWTLEGSMLAAELEKCVVMEKLQASSGQSSSVVARPKTKSTRGKPAKESNVTCFGSTHWTDRTEVILEFLQSEKKLKQRTKLILPLFKLLKICIVLEEQSPVEYLKQLILTSMTLCCHQDENAETHDSNDWIHFNVESIIDCLRCSRNPQTHHHALILLNYAARRYPEQVLHGIMSLFTFMGSSILRQDDAYSTQLIQQTVTTIIPTLASTGAIGKFSKTLVSAGIFRVFTSAVQDIPTHRRLPVFTSLVETLEPTESLWQVCIIILDNALTRDKRRSNLNADIDLATNLVWNFDAEVVLKTLERVYEYFSALGIYESTDDFRRVSNCQDAFSKAVIDLSRKESLRDVEIVILFTLELVSKICDKFSDLENKKLTYDFVLEKALSYSRTVSKIREDKIFRLITQRNFEVIGKINAVLEPKDFVRVTKSILSRDDLNVKKKMIDMLNHRIVQKADWFRDLDVLLELLPPLMELGSDTPETDEIVTIVQLAFLSLKLIGRQLAPTHPEEFIPVFNHCLAHSTNANRLLRASALLCISELFCLKSLILTHVQEMCSTIKKSLKSSVKLSVRGAEELLAPEDNIDGKENTTTAAHLLCISTMTCASKLIEQMGPFLGEKFLRKIIVIVLSTEGIFGTGEKANNRKKVFDLKLKALMKSVSTKIPLRNSLSPMMKVFKALVETQENRIAGIVVLMTTLKETLQNSTDKTEFTTLLPTLCDSFVDDFLMFRERVSSEEQLPVEYEPAENAIIDCLVGAIILKMSEGVFRPFYHRLLDWASDSLPRLITFYRVSAAAAERLKSLFVTFAGYVITQATTTLNKDATLTQAILKFFFHLFSNDREGFITTDRFNSLVQPILDLVECEYVINGTINIKDVNEVLVQLAVATNDLNRWQYLVELISLKSQNPDHRVRLFILSSLEAVISELGKDFLPLLPPAVPFLAELLIDDEREVEEETRKVLLKLEDAIGEPLEPYFMT